MGNESAIKPFISALLVTRNEKNYIANSLLSLVNQSYPNDRYEIIVIDGMSDDGTVECINMLVSSNPQGPAVRIIQNEKRILASGWNLGIQNAKGEYVIRIDAHAEVGPDFLEKNMQTMLAVDAVCVGGKLITKSLEGDNSVISKILSSPFGVGNSSFRTSNTAGYADTAVYGLYKKEIFDKAGLFNEDFVRNQDIEMHSRIKKAGGRFYFEPEIESVYYSRNTVKKMLKQAFGNGKWNMVLLKNSHAALSVRHLVPFAFVLYLAASLIGGFFWRPIWLLACGVLALHLVLGLAASVAKTRKPGEFLIMPVLFMMLHIAYGSGFFSGLFVTVNKK